MRLVCLCRGQCGSSGGWGSDRSRGATADALPRTGLRSLHSQVHEERTACAALLACKCKELVLY